MRWPRPVKKQQGIVTIMRAPLLICRLALLCAPFLLGSLMASTPAAAQSIVATVNGTPILSSDVAERRAFIRLTQKKNMSAKEVTDQLIDEVLLVKEASRRGLTVSDSQVDERYNQVAEQVKLSPAKLAEALRQGGASADTFKANIRSQLIYRKLVRAKSKSGDISEDLIRQQMQERKKEGAQAYDYKLRQIIFVLPKDASSGRVAQRMREAQGLRGRIKSCDQAGDFAKGLRDVAIKPVTSRTSAQLGDAFAAKLNKMKAGDVLPPERSDDGVSLIVLCSRSESSDDSALRAEIQNELAAKEATGEAKKFVADLRRQAIINYR